MVTSVAVAVKRSMAPLARMGRVMNIGSDAMGDGRRAGRRGWRGWRGR
jgi:hypothetical protein